MALRLKRSGLEAARSSGCACCCNVCRSTTKSLGQCLHFDEYDTDAEDSSIPMNLENEKTSTIPSYSLGDGYKNPSDYLYLQMSCDSGNLLEFTEYISGLSAPCPCMCCYQDPLPLHSNAETKRRLQEHELGRDVLLLAFQYLDVRDLVSARGVCSSWNRQSKSLDTWSGKTLVLGSVDLTDAKVEAMERSLNYLQSLELRWSVNLSLLGLRRLSSLASLRSLHLQGSLNDHAARYISSMSFLEELRIINSPVTDSGLMQLSELNALRYLCIEGCMFVSDSSLSTLVQSSLQFFHLSWLPRVNGSFLANALQLPCLRSLKLQGLSITSNNFAYFSNNLSAASVDLLNGTGIPSLLLEHLDVSFCRGFDDNAASHLSSLASLQSLHLQNTSITSVGFYLLMPVFRSNSLRFLDASCLSIDDEGIAALESAPSLHTVRLVGCQSISDTALKILATLPMLRDLYLRLCGRITPHGLSYIEKMYFLRTLDVSYCGNLRLEDLLCLSNSEHCRKLRIIGDGIKPFFG